MAPVVKVDHLTKVYGMWASPKARLAHPLLNALGQAMPSSRIARRLKGRLDGMYRAFHALHDVSFEVQKGESWGFVGVNGSGKSTLLKIISGNLRPTGGSVEVEGKVAILDYSSGISGEFTGRENVYLKASILGLSRREIDERFDSIAAFADIGEFIDQPVKTYSSGMAARLGFAIMAHVDADILITDEALAVGDAFFVQKCMAYIRSFMAKGTFLFVSHSVNDVVALCQKAVWLDHGRVMKIGPAKEVTDAYLATALMKSSKKYLTETVPAKATVATQPPPPPPPGATQLGQPELSTLHNYRPPRTIRDPRLEFLNRSPWRNDIQIPEFDPPRGSFGVGGAKIENVVFHDEAGAILPWVIGGEVVVIRIELVAERELAAPIVGFQVKDRLGQTLFADNTWLISREKPFSVRAGQRFHAEFCFQMPLLPRGEYVIRAAVAMGTEQEAAMLHVLDDALLFRSTTSGVRHGLVGVPMQHVKIELDDSLGPFAEKIKDEITNDGALIISGKRYPIVQRVAGALENAEVIARGCRVHGWAADQIANRPVSALIGTAGSRVVGRSLPLIPRPDIEAGVASGANPAGFEIDLLIGPAASASQPIRVYALMADGVAVQLAAANLAQRTGIPIENAPFAPKRQSSAS